MPMPMPPMPMSTSLPHPTVRRGPSPVTATGAIASAGPAEPLASPDLVSGTISGNVSALTVLLDIPASLTGFVSEQVHQWKFKDPRDYLLNLILNHQEHMEIRDQIMEGLRSGPSRFYDQDYLDALESFINAAQDLSPSDSHEVHP